MCFLSDSVEAEALNTADTSREAAKQAAEET